MEGSLFSALGVGFVLGVRHALDADHVAAVSTFVSRHRAVYRSCVVGTFWGLGHTAALLVAAVATIVLRVRIPPGADRVLEGLVAIAVVVLGSNVVVRALGSIRVHWHDHAHGEHSHRHLHVHIGGTMAHTHDHSVDDGKRPLLMGALHGLGGSAALLFLALATMPSTVAAVLYLVVFGVGSTVGMVLVSALISIPFAIGTSSERLRLALQLAVGVASVGVGVAMLWSLAPVT